MLILAAMVTVFSFENNTTAGIEAFESLMRLSVPVFSIGLVCLFVTLIKKKGSPFRWIFSNGAFYLISFGLIGSLMSGPLLFVDRSCYNELDSIYKNNRCQIVEGVVHVIHEQPKSGHDKGDIITINGIEFEVNHFVMTRAYTQTISHGGVLKEGVYARVYYYDGKILRIDVPEKLGK